MFEIAAYALKVEAALNESPDSMIVILWTIEKDLIKASNYSPYHFYDIKARKLFHPEMDLVSLPVRVETLSFSLFFSSKCYLIYFQVYSWFFYSTVKRFLVSFTLMNYRKIGWYGMHTISNFIFLDEIPKLKCGKVEAENWFFFIFGAWHNVCKFLVISTNMTKVFF